MNIPIITFTTDSTEGFGVVLATGLIDAAVRIDDGPMVLITGIINDAGTDALATREWVDADADFTGPEVITNLDNIKEIVYQ